MKLCETIHVKGIAQSLVQGKHSGNLTMHSQVRVVEKQMFMKWISTWRVPLGRALQRREKEESYLKTLIPGKNAGMREYCRGRPWRRSLQPDVENMPHALYTMNHALGSVAKKWLLTLSMKYSCPESET